MHSGGGSHGGNHSNSTFGGLSEYNPIEDFDLYWGMGPSQQQQQQLELDIAGSGLAVTPTRRGSNSGGGGSGGHHGVGGGGGGSGSGSGGSGGNGSGGGGGGLSSSCLSMGGGGLWSHVVQEAYGHRHHMHAPGDAGVLGGNTSGGSGSGGGGSSLASPPSGGPPPPISSRRSVWPSPSPTGGGTGSSSRNNSPLQMQQRHRPGSMDKMSNHHNNSSSIHASDVGARMAVATPAAVGGAVDARIHTSSGSIVDSKLEELAAAISSSLLGKLDLGPVTGALISQQQHTQHGPPRPVAMSSNFAMGETTAAVVAPLRSRVTVLEEQVAELKAALERQSSISQHSSASRRLPVEDMYNTSTGCENEQPPPPPLTSRGPQGGATAASRGRGGGGTGGSVSGASVSALEQSLSALVQRTGTLEGRHKQVQAKVALLDSAFGAKASDWAQTVRDILVEREAGGKAGGTGSSIIGRAAKKGGKNSAAGGSAGAGIRTTASQQVSGSTLGDECTNNSFRGASADSNISSSSNSKGGPGTLGMTVALKTSGAAFTKREANERSTGPVDTTGRGGREGIVATSRSSSVESGSSTTTTTTTATSQSTITSRCTSCTQVEERCARLEARVLESERATSLLRQQTIEANSLAAAAAAAADSGASKAAEAASAAAAAATAAREAAAMAKADYDATATAADAGGGGRHQQQRGASSVGLSVDKVAGDLKQLSERVKEGEDALVLVDHGLRSVREEVGVCLFTRYVEGGDNKGRIRGFRLRALSVRFVRNRFITVYFC